MLVVAARGDDVTVKSLRNAPQVHLLTPDQLNTYDVLCADDVVFTRTALEAFLARSTADAAAEARGGPTSRRPRRWPSELHSARIRATCCGGRSSPRRATACSTRTSTFVVAPDANKTEIKIAVEKVFDVTVTGVNTQNRQGKRRHTRFGVGRRPDTKRAIVTVAEGQRIDIFGGPVSDQATMTRTRNGHS